MREGSPNKFSTADPLLSGSRIEAKSLFRNILAPSPCGSRFYPDPTRSAPRKFLGMSILEKRKKKMSSARDPHRPEAIPRRSGLALRDMHPSQPLRAILATCGRQRYNSAFVPPRLQGACMLDRRHFLSTAATGVAASLALRGNLLAQLEKTPPLPDRSLLESKDAKNEDLFWAEMRKQFIIPEDEIYLNNGTVGSSPAPVLRFFFDDSATTEKWTSRIPKTIPFGDTPPGTSSATR